MQKALIPHIPQTQIQLRTPGILCTGAAEATMHTVYIAMMKFMQGGSACNFSFFYFESIPQQVDDYGFHLTTVKHFVLNEYTIQESKGFQYEYLGHQDAMCDLLQVFPYFFEQCNYKTEKHSLFLLVWV